MDQVIRILASALEWGIINRFRGWGDGWNGTKKPLWLVSLQVHVFSRPILSALQAIITSGYLYSQGSGLAYSATIFLALFAGWWLAVSPGWGLYFAAFTGIWKKDEKEIGWIDSICLHLVPFVSEKDEKSNRRRGRIAFGLRGVYYLPMFAAIAAAHIAFHGWSWTLLLPTAFFWQDGFVYGTRWTKANDNVAYCEPIGGAIRGALMASGLFLAT